MLSKMAPKNCCTAHFSSLAGHDSDWARLQSSCGAFQVWTPDVYEVRRRRSRRFFPPDRKAAAFALLLRIFSTVPAATHFWFWLLALAALTMFAGTGGTRADQRQAAPSDSSIAHAGYIWWHLRRSLPWRAAERGGSTRLCCGALLCSATRCEAGAFTSFRNWRAGEKNLSLDDLRAFARQPWWLRL